MKPSVVVLALTLAVSATEARAIQFEPKLTFRPDGRERSVALTFDACAGAFDQRIMDALVETRAKATIFVTDRWMRRNAQALAALMARPDQFEIENHGANHVPPVTDALEVFGIRSAGTIEGVKAEVRGGESAIRDLTGLKPKWFRGATARYSDDALKAILAMGYRIGGYSRNADKGASLSAAESLSRMSAAEAGDVVIAHINQPHRAAGEGVAAGIKALAASGARFVRLDDVDARLKEENHRPLVVEPAEIADRPEPAPRRAKAEPKVEKLDAAGRTMPEPVDRTPRAPAEPPASKPDGTVKTSDVRSEEPAVQPEMAPPRGSSKAIWNR